MHAGAEEQNALPFAYCLSDRGEIVHRLAGAEALLNRKRERNHPDVLAQANLRFPFKSAPGFQSITPAALASTQKLRSELRNACL
jgi:hypothetical protein